jgi:uncharacterized membrane protein
MSVLFPPSALAAPRWFLRLGLAVGLTWIALFPPFQTPDAYVHFYRAYALSEGQWCCERIGDGVGGMLPRGIEDLSTSLFSFLEFASWIKADLVQIEKAFEVPLQAEERVFIDYWQTAGYSPVPYLPQAAGIILARLAGAGPLTMLYAARIANWIVWTALITLAIACARRYGWLLFQFALLPMTLSLGTAVSADALMLALAALYTGLVLGARQTPVEAEPRWRTATLAVVFIMFALCKAYMPLWGLVLIAPAYRRGRRLALLLGALAVGSALALAWAVSARALATTHAVDAAKQLAIVRTLPVQTMRTLASSVIHSALELRQMIGSLAWLNLSLPQACYPLYALLLIGTGLFSVGRMRLSWRARAGLLAIAAILHVAVYLQMYLVATPAGHTAVWGLQGRYFLPYLPVVLLALSGAECGPIGRAWRSQQHRMVPLANLALLIAVTWQITARYYGQ